MTVFFRCGHHAPIDPDKATSPRCPECGEGRVAFTQGVGAPRIVGHARGPLVEQQHLGAVAVRVAKTPLALKDPDDGE